MTLEPYLIYINEQARAITFAKSEENAVEAFRAAMLGQKIEGTGIRAAPAWTAPVDDVMRVGILGLYARMFSGDMAARMQGH